MSVQIRSDSDSYRRAASIVLLVTVLGIMARRVPAQIPCGGDICGAVNHAIQQVQQVAAPVAQVATNAGTATVNAAIAPTRQLVNVIDGSATLPDAFKNVAKAQGEQYSAIGQVLSATNAASTNIQIVAAESIGGDAGKIIMTIETGSQRLQVEFASTAAIEAGGLVSGKLRPEELLAAPLSAAIRAAEKQFEVSAQPLPPDVRSMFASLYPAEVLDAARWTVGSISISVPDVTNQFRKIEGIDNAVTVGHITVFVREPGQAYHWWAHELQHQVQYRDWGGIDSFAYKYVTSCHDVESNAEDKAQQVYPIVGRVSLGC